MARNDVPMLTRPRSATHGLGRARRGIEPWLVGWVALVLAGCASNQTTDEKPVSDPPGEQALLANAQNVYKAVKMPGTPLLSPVRRAHPIAPGDWIVCLRSDDPAWTRTMALFFTGAAMVEFRGAVAVDDCGNETYMPIAKP